MRLEGLIAAARSLASPGIEIDDADYIPQIICHALRLCDWILVYPTHSRRLHCDHLPAEIDVAPGPCSTTIDFSNHLSTQDSASQVILRRAVLSFLYPQPIAVIV